MISLQIFQSSFYEEYGKIKINLWCHNEDGEVILITIDDYLFFHYFLFSREVKENIYEYVDSPCEITDILNCCNNLYRDRSKKNSKVFERFEIIKRFPLYNYTTEIRPYIKCFASSEFAVNTFKKQIERSKFIITERNSEKIKYKFEYIRSDVDPIMKFLTEKNLRHTGWFSVNENDMILVSEDEKHTTGNIREYRISHSNILECTDPKYSSLQIYPKHLSFDIESYSDDGSFTSPDKEGHVCYMISVITERLNSDNTRKYYLFLFGDYDYDYIMKAVKDRRIDDSLEINTYVSEEDMLRGFEDFFIEYDPTLISGYNIENFDFRYIHKRLQKAMVSSVEDINDPNPWNHHMSRHKHNKFIPKLKEASWESSAFGKNVFYHLCMEGRICIDMLVLVRREYKLKTYSLKAVSKHFFGEDKNKIKIDLPITETFKIYERWLRSKDNNNRNEEEWNRTLLDMSKIVEYCIRDSAVVCELITFMNSWVVINQFASVMNSQIDEIIYRGQQLKCFNSLYRTAEMLGYVMNERSVNTRNNVGGFVQDPIVGVNDDVICVDFSSLYPSIMIGHNLCYSTLIPEQNLSSPYVSSLKDNIEIVTISQMEPVNGFSNPKAIEDIVPLLGETTLISGKKPKPQPVEMKEVTYKFGWVQKNVRQGIVPITVKKLLDERKAVRREQSKHDKNSSIYKLLESKQLSLKLLANSLYGFVGASIGRRPLFEMAMTICYIGRTSIQRVANTLKDKFGAIFVYGDTDSAMVRLPSIIQSKQCNYWGNIVADYINGYKKDSAKPKLSSGIIKYYEEDRERMFPEPMGVEFEKAMRQFCVSKKRYAYFSIKPDGSFEKDPKNPSRNKLIFKGLDPARRDKCELLLETYVEIIYRILEKEPFIKNIQFLFSQIRKLFSGTMDVSNFIVVKTYKGEYKSQTAPMKYFCDRLIRSGVNVVPGERVEYITAEPSSIPWIGEAELKNMRESYKYISKDEYFESLKTDKPFKIDLIGYFNKVLVNPIDQILDIAYKNEFNVVRQYLFFTKKKQLKTRIRKDKYEFESLLLYISKYITHKIYNKKCDLSCESYISIINKVEEKFINSYKNFKM